MLIRYDHAPSGAGLSLRPVLPASTPEVLGIDLTHVITAHDVVDISYAKGGNGGGGGSGGGGGGKGGGPGGGGGDGGGSNSFDNYISGPLDHAAGYNIEIEFAGTWTQEYYDIFVAAADRLTALITGDVEDVKLISGGGKPATVDDIVISAELGVIDGSGGILGQAGPTAVRTVGSLPAKAIMQFDIDDAGDYLAVDLFDDIVLHEMAHSLGFGSIWDLVGVVENGLFVGEAATAEYVALGGDAAGIPVEQEGGAGTAGSHWDETIFEDELMTGYIDATNYFTAMSAASFADIGYTVAADFTGIVDAGYMLA